MTARCFRITLTIFLLLPLKSVIYGQLISHLPFDKSSRDEKGGNHAEIFNAAFSTGAALGSHSLQFGDREVNRCAWLGDFKFPVNGFTISLWVKPSPQTMGHQTLLSKRSGWSEEKLAWQFLYGAPRTKEQLQNEDYDYFRFESYVSRAEFKYKLDTSRWTHLALTYQSDVQEVALYIDGVRHEASGQQVQLGEAHNAHVVVGGPHPSDWKEIFNGKIDDVAIWKGPLTDDRIRFLVQMGRDARFRLDASTVDALVNLHLTDAPRPIVIGDWRWANLRDNVDGLGPNAAKFDLGAENVLVAIPFEQ